LYYSTQFVVARSAQLFGLLLNDKRKQNETAIFRLTNGVAKLKECSAAVSHLESNLKEMLLAAEEKSEVSAGIANRVSAEKEIVEKATGEANEEAEKVGEMQTKISAQQAEAEGEVSSFD